MDLDIRGYASDIIVATQGIKKCPRAKTYWRLFIWNIEDQMIIDVVTWFMLPNMFERSIGGSLVIFRPKMIVWSGAIIHPLMILLNHWHHRRHLNNHLYCRHHHHQTEMKIRPCSFHLLHKSLYDKSFPLQIDQFSIHNTSFCQLVCLLLGKAYTTPL